MTVKCSYMKTNLKFSVPDIRFDACKSLICVHFRGIYDWPNLKWDKAYQAKILRLDISNHKWKYLRQQQQHREKMEINLNIMSTGEIKRSKTKQRKNMQYHLQAKINRKSKACLFKFLSEFKCDFSSSSSPSTDLRHKALHPLSHTTWMMIVANSSMCAISKHIIKFGPHHKI